jgi:hypothetical protein
MRFAYADPPYLGCAAKLYGDPTYDDPEAHRRLINRMCDEYSDGWAMSLHTPSLRIILPMCPEDARVGSWVKPFCAFKVGVNPAYAWEPVIFRGGRKKRSRKEDTIRDYHSEPITLRRGMPGAKPPGFVKWIVDLLGADVRQGDTITDLFHGSGAMLGVWRPHQKYDVDNFASRDADTLMAAAFVAEDIGRAG